MAKFTPLPPQPLPQSGSPRIAIPPASLNITDPSKPVVSNLNANVTSAVASYGYTDILGTLRVVAFMITFSTNAVIAANGNLFTVTFVAPFLNIPVVVVGGGPVAFNAFEAGTVTRSNFIVFATNAVGNSNGQGCQFIAVGH